LPTTCAAQSSSIVWWTRPTHRLTRAWAACRLVVVVPGMRPGISFPNIPHEVLTASSNRIVIVSHRSTVVRHTDIRDMLSTSDGAEMDATRRVIALIAACDQGGLNQTFEADQDPGSHSGSKPPESSFRQRNYGFPERSTRSHRPRGRLGGPSLALRSSFGRANYLSFTTDRATTI